MFTYTHMHVLWFDCVRKCRNMYRFLFCLVHCGHSHIPLWENSCTSTTIIIRICMKKNCNVIRIIVNFYLQRCFCRFIKCYPKLYLVTKLIETNPAKREYCSTWATSKRCIIFYTFYYHKHIYLTSHNPWTNKLHRD